MDFSHYPSSTVIDMTVYDLPADADVFLLRDDRFTLAIGASSASASRHWEYRMEYDRYVWRIWDGATPYYANHGDPLSRDLAERYVMQYITRYMIDSNRVPHELQLPDGL